MTTSQIASAMPRSVLMRFTIVVFAVVGLFPSVQAVSVRFLPLNDEVAARKIAVRDGKGVFELKDLNAKKRSKAYVCSGGEKPLVLEALDRERPNGKAASVEITLASDMKSPLVLIFPDADHPSGMRVMAVDDSDAGFAWGSVRFVNTTDGPLMVRYDTETKEVPESYAFADIVPGGEARNMGIQLFADAEPDAVLYSAVWEHDPNLRKLVFIIPAADPKSKRLSLAMIPEDKRAKR